MSEQTRVVHDNVALAQETAEDLGYPPHGGEPDSDDKRNQIAATVAANGSPLSDFDYSGLFVKKM